MKASDVILIKKWAVGNPRIARIRVDSVSSRDQVQYRDGVPTDQTFTIWTVTGVEVVKSDFSPRRYFGGKTSRWRVHLKKDDFQIVG